MTTANTVTHDAGEPEWLDLPLTDFVVDATPEIDELPLVQELDPPWLLQSKWLTDEIDLGRPVIPIVEFRDPLGFTLMNETLSQTDSEQVFVPTESTTVPWVVVLPLDHLWYTVAGVYTFIVRWIGSPATRESGRFSILIAGS